MEYRNYSTIDQRFSTASNRERDVPSFIEPRPPLILNPFMRPKPQKGTNLMELFDEDSIEEEAPELVQVYLRLKPTNVQSNLYEVRSDQCLITSLDTATAGHGRRTQHNVCKAYSFSHIFGPDATQKEIFECVVKDNLRKLPDGHNFTLLTYGASGSGKTYSLMGTVKAPGLVPRSLEYVFKVVDAAQTPLYHPGDSKANKLNSIKQAIEIQRVNELRDISEPLRYKYRRMSRQLCGDLTKSTCDLSNRTKYYVWVSFVEIYNEAIYDLLVTTDRTAASKLRIREDPSGNAYVKGATQAFVRSGEEAYDVMVAGKHNLQVHATGVHANSSRSHCIFTITMLTETETGVRSSYVRLCDLAGSERAQRTHNTGARMAESRAINSSLHVLERCLHALQRRRTHAREIVPYRESKLTRLLGAGLSGTRGEAVSMVVTLNPAPEYAHETKHTLQLATVAREIQVNNTIVETETSLESTSSRMSIESSTETLRLRAENERLKFELAHARAMNDKLLSQMEEQQEENAGTIHSLVQEARDIDRQFYTDQIDTLKRRHEIEIEDLREEYEAKLKEKSNRNAVSEGDVTPTRSLRNKVLLKEKIAILEEELSCERLARARAEQELVHLRICLEQRNEKSSDKNSVQEDAIELTDSEESTDSEDSANESLEPTFKKEDINRSRLTRQSNIFTNNSEYDNMDETKDTLKDDSSSEVDDDRNSTMTNHDDTYETPKNGTYDVSNNDSCDSQSMNCPATVKKAQVKCDSESSNVAIDTYFNDSKVEKKISRETCFVDSKIITDFEDGYVEDEDNSADTDVNDDNKSNFWKIAYLSDSVERKIPREAYFVNSKIISDFEDGCIEDHSADTDVKDDNKSNVGKITYLNDSKVERKIPREAYVVNSKIISDFEDGCIEDNSADTDVKDDNKSNVGKITYLNDSKVERKIPREAYFVKSKIISDFEDGCIEDNSADTDVKDDNKSNFWKITYLKDSVERKIPRESYFVDSKISLNVDKDTETENVGDSTNTDLKDDNKSSKVGKATYFNDSKVEKIVFKENNIVNSKISLNAGENTETQNDVGDSANTNVKEDLKSSSVGLTEYFNDSKIQKKISRETYFVDSKIILNEVEKDTEIDKRDLVDTGISDSIKDDVEINDGGSDAVVSACKPLKHIDSQIDKIKKFAKTPTSSDNSLTQFELLEIEAEEFEKEEKKTFKYFDDGKDKTDIESPKKLKEKKTYFDNIDPSPKLDNVTDLLKKQDLRSPSIVVDEIPENYKPTTINKLMGESFTKHSEVPACNKRKVLLRSYSIDIFEELDSPCNKDNIEKVKKTTKNSEVKDKLEDAKSLWVDEQKVDKEASDAINTYLEKLDTKTPEEKFKSNNGFKNFKNPDKISVNNENQSKQGISQEIQSQEFYAIEKHEIQHELNLSAKQDVNVAEITAMVKNNLDLTNTKDLEISVQNEIKTEELLTNCSVLNNTMETFENFFKDVTLRTTDFELLLSETAGKIINEKSDDATNSSNNERIEPDTTQSDRQPNNIFVKPITDQTNQKVEEKIIRQSEQKIAEVANKLSKSKTNESKENTKANDTSIKEDNKTEDTVENTVGVKYNLRHRTREVEFDKISRSVRKSSRLRRQNKIDEDEDSTLKDIGNLQKEFSDVTLDVPAPIKHVKDIQSPEKIESENLPPMDVTHSCPSKSVTRSRRKLFTPQVEALEESPSQVGDSNERVRVPRPSYHRKTTRTRRRLN